MRWFVGLLIIGMIGNHFFPNQTKTETPRYPPSFQPTYTTNYQGTPDKLYTPVSDVDCFDIGEPVYVGSNDPYNLDEDGDGWGCESYGVGGSDYYEDPYYEDPYYEDPYYEDPYYDDGSGGDPFYEYP